MYCEYFHTDKIEFIICQNIFYHAYLRDPKYHNNTKIINFIIKLENFNTIISSKLKKKIFWQTNAVTLFTMCS